MRLAARGFERRALGLRQAQGGAVVDRRPAERLLALAAPVELLCRLIGGVEPAESFEPRGCFLIGRHALRLAPHEVRPYSEPLEIVLDGVGVFRL